MYDSWKGNIKEHVVHFLNFIGPYAHDADLYLKEFLNSLTDKAYTCMSTWSQAHYVTGHTVSPSSTPSVFYAEATFTFSKLNLTQKYSKKDLDV